MLPRFDVTVQSAQKRKKLRGGYIGLSLIIALSCLSLIFQYQIFHSLNQYFVTDAKNEIKDSLRRIVSVARNAAEPIIAEVRSEKISMEEGRSRMRALVRTMTYEDNYGPNYVFLNTYSGILLVQPFDPSRELTDMFDSRDSQGFAFVQAVIKAARNIPTGSFLSYFYAPPGKTEPEEKLSYVIGIPELDMALGTGMYARAYSERRESFLSRAGTESLVLMVCTVLGALFVAFSLLSANRKLKTEINLLTDAEAALARSEGNLQNVFDLLEECVLIHDEVGSILDCNDGAMRMFAMTREEALSSTVFTLSVPGYNEREVKLLYDKLTEGSIFRFDWKSKSFRGEREFDCEIILKRGKWNDKLVFIAEVRDVSAQKSIENALLARTRELERFERLVVGRELRMIELKKRLAEFEPAEGGNGDV